jgi:tetratricopeptide (TPR) repeat protein
MSQALYEHYKEALRRGHVAALRGRLDVAEAAYLAAAALAPDRALPYTSLGGVFRRQDRREEALAAYGAGLARAPEDEGALRGRAELHAEAGRRLEAATDHEALSGVLERAGRLTEACDAARRALELAESRSRRHEVERLVALLRERVEDQPAVDALDRALRILETVERPTSGPNASVTGVGPAAAPDEPEASPGTVGTDAPEYETAPPPEPAVLRAVADALLDSGDVAGAGDRYLGLAALHRAAGRPDAAMDACLAFLALAPADHRLQLAMAAIQADQGWAGIAAEKLRLLARLAELDEDAEASAAVAAFAMELGLAGATTPAAGV